MSILDRHPAPWTLTIPPSKTGYCEGKYIIDATGACVASGETVEVDSGGEIPAGIDVESAALPLILAAPELLAALGSATEALHGYSGPTAMTASLFALIARIEGGK